MKSEMSLTPLAHQAGNIGGVPRDGDKMLDRFTKDMQAIAQEVIKGARLELF